MRYGAIDIGTNAARLLIGEVVENASYKEIKKISYTRIPLRLGMDVFDKGLITKQKQEEFVKTVQAFKLICEVFHVNVIKACATSAMREAKNGEEVQKEIKKKTNINIEIISGDDEAKLIFQSFFSISVSHKKPFIVADLGGGSLEITIFEKGQIVKSKSFDVGTIRILKNMVNDDDWKELAKWLKANIKSSKKHDLYATGGNINKIHKIFGLKHLEPISAKDLKRLHTDLKKITIDERIHKYDLKEDRADVIVPACDVYLRVAKTLNISSIIVPKIGLSDGMIFDLYNKSRQ